MKRSALLLLLCLTACLATGCANRLFYQPTSALFQTPAGLGLRHEDVTFESKDGTDLNGWFLPAQGKAKGTVVHFHGNAGNMSDHLVFVSWLPARGFNVLMFDYRGYGKSEGSPRRRGIYEDSVAAVIYAQSRSDVDPNRIVLFGQSLGGANAISAMGRNGFAGVHAVAVEGAFYSYRSIARDKIGEIPIVGLLRAPLALMLVSNGYSAGHVVDQIAPVPLLLIHGTGDAVVPAKHSTLLYAKARQPKDLWFVKYARHVEVFGRWAPEDSKHALVDFFNAALEDTDE